MHVPISILNMISAWPVSFRVLCTMFWAVALHTEEGEKSYCPFSQLLSLELWSKCKTQKQERLKTGKLPHLKTNKDYLLIQNIEERRNWKSTHSCLPNSGRRSQPGERWERSGSVPPILLSWGRRQGDIWEPRDLCNAGTLGWLVTALGSRRNTWPWLRPFSFPLSLLHHSGKL